MRDPIVTTSLALLVAGILSGCGSSLPGCSDSDTQEILAELLQEEAQMLAIMVPGRLGYAESLVMLAPMSLAKIQQRELGEAFQLIEDAVQSQPDSDHVKLLRTVLAQAKKSTFSLDGITTLRESERRSDCKVQVKFTFGLPTAQDLGDSRLQSALDAARVLQDERTYQTYYSDDGTHYVEVDPPK